MRLVQSVCLTLFAAVFAVSNAMASPMVEGGDSIRTYTFDDLSSNCGSVWSATTTSGLYQDLAFPSPAFMAVCAMSGNGMVLQPSEFVGGRVEVRVGLPGPVMAVSIDAYLFDYADAPTLIAYDSMGVEVGRASSGSMNTWSTLEVQAGATPITEIGLLMPQLVVYLDNVTLTFGVAEVPRPEPEPEPEPDVVPSAADPVGIAACQQGGWLAFGFRNQGQCVSFVRNGRDSR